MTAVVHQRGKTSSILHLGNYLRNKFRFVVNY